MDIVEGSDFSIHNIPFGIFSNGEGGEKRLASAYGDEVIDLAFLWEQGLFDDFKFDRRIFVNDYLNDFIGLGKAVTSSVRQAIIDFLKSPEHVLWQKRDDFMWKMAEVELHLPVSIGDYTDFYSSEAHATNVGKMFRDEANALLPNWKHMPVAYHGRASTIFVSGTNFKRPKGQIKPHGVETPYFSPTRRLDFELEMAALIGKDSEWQKPVGANETGDYVFGYALFNDWSARDIQHWEYVPLGPFLGKNFFSSMSPWIVTSEALEPFKVKANVQDPPPLDYLQEDNRFLYDINLKVYFQTREGQKKLISTSNYKNIYWSIGQQIAHHTINGCQLRIGDVLASGTISGEDVGSFGSLLEITWGGKNPIMFEDGSTRTFVEDGDTIIFEGFAGAGKAKIGFGKLINTVLG